MLGLVRKMAYHRLVFLFLFVTFLLSTFFVSTSFFTKLVQRTFVQDVQYFTDTYRSRAKELLSDIDEVSRRLSFAEYGFSNGTASDAQFFPNFLNDTLLGESSHLTTFYIDLVTVDEWTVVGSSNSNIYFSLKNYSVEDISYSPAKNLPYTSVYTLRPPSSDNLYHVLYSSYGRSAQDLRDQALSSDTDCLQYSYSYKLADVVMPLCGGIVSVGSDVGSSTYIPIFKPIYTLKKLDSPSGSPEVALSSQIAGYLLVYADSSFLFPNRNSLLGDVSYAEGMSNFQNIFWSAPPQGFFDSIVPSFLITPVALYDSSGYTYRFRATYRYIFSSPMFGVYVTSIFVNFIISALVLFLLGLLWRTYARLDDLVGAKTRVIQDDNRRLEELSFRDGLTGLYNRRFFDISIDSELSLARRLTTNITLLIVDIDHFKDYNDNYGHTRGDEALRAVANILSTSFLRSGDIVTRYGGEEFAIILPRVDRVGVHTIARRLMSRFEKANLPHDYSAAAPYMTVSIGGITVTPGDDFSYLEMVILADGMLYLSKRSGRNKYTLFSPENDDHLKFLADVRGDMDEDSFVGGLSGSEHPSIFGSSKPRLQGDAGNAGDTGNAGDAGNAGNAGNTGNAGDAGDAGNAGDTGDTGNAGKNT